MKKTALLLLIALFSGGPALGANPKITEALEAIEKNQRDPYEQRRRESAIRKLAKVGTVHAVKALLPLFDDPFVHIADHATSAFLKMAKGDSGKEVRAWLCKDGLTDRRPAVRRATAIALGFARDAEAADAFRTRLKKERDPLVLAALAEAAPRLPGPPDFKDALRDLLSHRNGTVVLAAAEACAELDDREAVETLVKTLGHKDPLGRAGAVLALQSLDALPPGTVEKILTDRSPEPSIALAETLWLSTDCLPWPGPAEQVLLRLLAAPSWRVRVAGLEGALRIWQPGIVDPLIDRLDKEEGRLKDEVRQALETYTGQALGDDIDLWKAWWKGKAQEFKAGPRPRPDLGGRIPRRRGGSEDGGSVAFFDLPVYSKRIAFIFDLSGSMRNAVAKGEELKKIELLVEEFQKTLDQLPGDTRFDLLVYRYPSTFPPKPELTRSFGRLEGATKANRNKAAGWLRKQNSKGWGAFFEPLLAALEEDVDTIFLLSDGRPSRGVYDRDFRILAEFPKANRFKLVAVNTILIGTAGADREFMEALADLTGGRFREAGK